jgi:hypothetical protein
MQNSVSRLLQPAILLRSSCNLPVTSSHDTLYNTR